MTDLYQSQRVMRNMRRAALQRGVIAILDVGTSKIACLVLRFEGEGLADGNPAELFEAKGETFKAELIRDLPGDETITTYSTGMRRKLALLGHEAARHDG